MILSLFFAAALHYHVVRHIPIGGEAGWDYPSVADGRLYVAHGDTIAVVDIAKGNVIASMPSNGAHGVVVAKALGRGFYSNGKAGTITVFDLNTFKVLGDWKATGENPDAILYDEPRHELYSFNGRGHNATVFDARTGAVVATIPLAGKPEFPQRDGDRIFVNIEDTSEMAEIDAAHHTVVKRWPLKPCTAPTGLAIDRLRKELYSGCENRTLVVSSYNLGRVVHSAPIGEGCDGVAFDGKRVISANGRDGTITVIASGAVIDTVPTAPRARTIVFDEATKHLFLPAKEKEFEVVELAP